MPFPTLQHILTHISVSTILIVIMIHLITLLVRELKGLHDPSEKGTIAIFLSITCILVSH
jgi:hypothetical protein